MIDFFRFFLGLSGGFSARQAQSKVVKKMIFPTELEVHLEDIF
jgi:hypothetical protein